MCTATATDADGNTSEFSRRTILPVAVKLVTVDALLALLPSGDKKTDHRIGKAIKHIQKSLAEKLWEDETTLAKKGKKVFDEEKKAVHELMKIGDPPVAIARAIRSLVRVDALLAQTAIHEAVDAGGDAKKITKARKEMDKAGEEIGKDHRDKAIEHYKKAWQHAQRAIGKEAADDASSDDGISADDDSADKGRKSGKAVAASADLTVDVANYPNPFNPVTTIAYSLPEASDVSLTIYTVTGQRVGILVSGHRAAGRHEVVWDGSRLADGVYFCRLEAGASVETRRMLLLK